METLQELKNSDLGNVEIKEAKIVIDQLKENLEETEQKCENLSRLFKESKKEYENLLEKDQLHLQELEQEFDKLKEKLDIQKDYEEIKDQLSIIKKIEFDQVEKSQNLSIEQLLHGKNKKLQGQLMESKNQSQEKDVLISNLKESLLKSESRVNALSSLVANLEADVLKLNQVLDSKHLASPKMVIIKV